MSIFNKLQFDDIDSLRNGVYITGEAVYNSPERDVELIEIPGRNGDLVLDKKRFKNIEVKYKAGAKGQTKDDFSNVMRSFRSLMASKRGYKRLTDTYNPDEFRLGTFIDAIEVEPSERKKAGEFDLIFNCKPQRFLMSGEAGIDIDHGELAGGYKLFNPTPFESQPLIEAEGYGVLTINGHNIELVNETLGDLILIRGGSDSPVQFDANLVNSNDDITIDRVELVTGFGILPSGSTVAVTTVTPPGTADYSINGSGYNTTMRLSLTDLGSEYGISDTVTESWVVSIALTRNGVTTTEQLTITLTVSYDGANEFSFNINYSGGTFLKYIETKNFGYSDVKADSTVTTLGHPTYIDCELGEVYKVENGSYISLNHLIDLGSILPVLMPGENIIYGENSFSSVSIVPRWWLL